MERSSSAGAWTSSRKTAATINSRSRDRTSWRRSSGPRTKAAEITSAHHANSSTCSVGPPVRPAADLIHQRLRRLREGTKARRHKAFLAFMKNIFVPVCLSAFELKRSAGSSQPRRMRFACSPAPCHSVDHVPANDRCHQLLTSFTSAFGGYSKAQRHQG